MISSVSKNLLILAFLLGAPITLQLEHMAMAGPVEHPSPTSAAKDRRAVRLAQFLGRLHCPVKDLAEEFVHAADDNDLDWRLLPSISIIESSGGKAYRNNNVMGWANGDQVFPTIRAGIHRVAFSLGKSFIYRNRSTDEKLRLYNPADDYPSRVEDVMYRISPVPEVQINPERIPFTRPDMGLLSRN